MATLIPLKKSLLFVSFYIKKVGENLSDFLLFIKLGIGLFGEFLGKDRKAFMSSFAN